MDTQQYAYDVTTGRQITQGDLLQGSRDETWTFEGVGRPAEGNSTGRVAVSAACEDCDHFWHRDGIEQREFFPSVFGLYLGDANGVKA